MRFMVFTHNVLMVDEPTNHVGIIKAVNCFCGLVARNLLVLPAIGSCWINLHSMFVYS